MHQGRFQGEFLCPARFMVEGRSLFDTGRQPPEFKQLCRDVTVGEAKQVLLGPVQAVVGRFGSSQCLACLFWNLVIDNELADIAYCPLHNPPAQLVF